MCLEQTAVEEHAEAEVLACLPSSVAVVDVDLSSVGELKPSRKYELHTNHGHLIVDWDQRGVLDRVAEHTHEEVQAVER